MGLSYARTHMNGSHVIAGSGMAIPLEKSSCCDGGFGILAFNILRILWIYLIVIKQLSARPQVMWAHIRSVSLMKYLDSNQ